MPDPPDRPVPARAPLERARHWVAWFGPWRLVAGTLAVLAVAAGGYLLVRTPPPTAEATLPVATTVVTTTPVPAVDDVTEPPAPDGAAGRVGGAPTEPTHHEVAPAVVVVHVVGEVAAPGVHELPVGARVVDAVDAAGGPTRTATLDALNLAAPLVDGQRVRVPAVGDEVPDVPDYPPGVAPGRGEGVSGLPAAPIDLNRAGVGELTTLPGIGPATAAAIVDHRERNGPFASVDDLMAVRGIGPAKLDAVRDVVTV